MIHLALATVLAVIGSSADVRSLAVDGEHAWVGTTSGLLVLAPGEREAVEGLPAGTVHALLLDGDALWAGTDHGLARIDRASRRVTWTAPSEGPVRAIVRAEGALLYARWGQPLGCHPIAAPDACDGLVPERLAALTRITALGATRGGLYVATARRGAFYVRGGRVRRLRGDHLCFAIAAGGRDAWIGCSGGLRRFRNGRRVRDAAARGSRSLPIADIRAVIIRDGAPIVGTMGAGAFEWTGDEWRALAGQPSWLAGAPVAALALSAGGSILAGTAAGLALPRDGTFTRELLDDLPDEDLTSLARTGEGLWVGTFQHGLALVHDDGRIERFDEADGLVDGRINRLTVDAEGDLWIATDRGVMERERGRFHMRGLLGRHVFMVGLAGGRIWAAAGGDLVVRTPNGWSRVATLDGRRPQDATTFGGAVRVATAEGLARESGDAFVLDQSRRGGLVDDWITALAEYRGRLVAGTYNAGLAYVDASGAERLRDELWVNAGALAVAGDLLAVGTLDQGLWLYDGADWRTLTTADGLPDDDVTAILPLDDGSMWVATRGGLAYVGEGGSIVE